ncbi:hypothetical protein VTN02DRAFT_4845 [Thermoascus thermophilus]
MSVGLLVLLCLMTAALYVVYRPPPFLLCYFQRRWPDVLWQVSTPHRIMALTIDDAPSEYTDEIRQILRAHGATATFFVIGSQVPGREGTLRDLVRDGHELANHAMHDEPSRALSDGVLVEQIRAVQRQIHAVYASAGVDGPPDYFRPGSGFFSARMRKVLAELGYRLVLGGVYPHDAQIPLWRVNAAHVLSMLRPGGIIICHDRRGWTAPMLRKVLPEMKRRGYRVVTVTELLKEGRT